MTRFLPIGLVALVAQITSGQMVISEWMYLGAGTEPAGEFVEFTNAGPNPVDMTGWSYDDDSRVAGTVSLSAFGVVPPGESVILTEETASGFATIWGLSQDVRIIGGSTDNLGRNDEINLFDASGNLVDRLTYGDESYPGTVRTRNRSCNIPLRGYEYTVVQTDWVLAEVGDLYGSWVSLRGEIASPGLVSHCAANDLDSDGDVDLNDLDLLESCGTGPAVSYDSLPPGCALTPDVAGYIVVDFDRDGDVDQDDFAVFQRCYTGDGNPPMSVPGHMADSPGGSTSSCPPSAL